jgi:hypothetical protein
MKRGSKLICLVLVTVAFSSGCNETVSESTGQSIKYNATAELDRMQSFLRNTSGMIKFSKVNKEGAEKIVVNTSKIVQGYAKNIELRAPDLHMACAKKLPLKCGDLYIRYLSEILKVQVEVPVKDRQKLDSNVSAALRTIDDSIKIPKFNLDKFGNIAIVMHRFAHATALRLGLSDDKASLDSQADSQMALWEDDNNNGGGGGGGSKGPRNVFGGDFNNPLDATNIAMDLADGTLDGRGPGGIPTSWGGLTDIGNPFYSRRLDPTALLGIAGAVLSFFLDIPRLIAPV